MTLDKHIEKFGKEFVSIPVKNVRYWEDFKVYIGETMLGCEYHPKHSTIAFEFFDTLNNEVALAYKPMSCYKK